MLQTKLYIPPLRPDLVPRSGLIARLNQGLEPGCKLILVSAPAGFGKTTLVIEWLAQLAGQDFIPAWLSLDERDNDLNLFLTYLLTTLETALPEVDGLAESLNAPQAPETTALLTTMLNEIDRSPGQIVLVLDDYHHIGNVAIHEGLAFLAQNAVPNLHLVITSRGDLPFGIARLRASREMVELRAQDLRFTVGETADLFNEQLGLNLPPEDVAALAERTEGWVTGLQLAALALQGGQAPAERSDFVRSFSGTHRYVLDYLVEEVLARQPAALQAFLQQTAILERLNAPLCDALTGREDSRAVLESLAQSNLFLLPLDDERRWYRYHQLFADLLRARGLDDPALEGQHRRAAGWYRAHGFPADAFYHWLEAGAVEEAVSVVEDQAMTLLNQGYPRTILAWIDRLPAETAAGRPWLVVYRAWALLLTGHARDALSWLEDGPPPAEPQMNGHVAAIRGYAAALLGDFAGAVELLTSALELLGPEGQTVRSVIAFAMGGIQLMAGQLATAEHMFLEAAQSGQTVNNRHLAVSAWYAAASLQLAKAQLSRAEETYRSALDLAHTPSGKPLPVAAQAYNGLATLAYERNDLTAAGELIEAGLALARRGPGPDAFINSLLLRAVFRLAQGELNGAWRDWQEADQSAAGQTLGPFSTGRLLATGIEVARARGDRATVDRLMDEHASSAAEAITFAREEEGLALVHTWLDRGRADRALSILGPYIVLAREQARDGSLVRLLALQAVALQARGLADQALESLVQALSLAETEGYVRSFVDQGPAVARLLRKAKVEGDRLTYVRALLQAFTESKAAFAKGETDHPAAEDKPNMVEPLTERELEVLQLVAMGLSNQAIADELVLATGTVKAHVSRIMGKLGAHNRTEAVALARESDLIP